MNYSSKVLHNVSSVLLDSTIDTANEDIGGIKSNGSCQEPEASDHDKCVAKVEQSGYKIHNVELEERERSKFTTAGPHFVNSH